MPNPYQAPTASVSPIPGTTSTKAGKVSLGIGLGCAVLAAAILTLVVPNFGQTFEAFGADLPLVTRLVLNFYLAIWALPLAVLAAWFRWPTQRRRALASCLIGILGLVLLVPLLFIALYLPIFQLAAAA